MTKSIAPTPKRLDARPDRQRFVALRLATLARIPGFQAGPAALQQLAAMWARADQLGLVHLHRPEAQLMWFRDPQVWFGGPATLAFADRDTSVMGSLDALLAAVASHAFDETTWLEVDALDLALVHGLIALGFAIDSVIQVGDARTALTRLVTRYDPPPTLAHVGLELRLARRADVDATIELHRRVFSEHPEHCFFGARPSHLARMASAMRRDLDAGGPAAHWIVTERDGIVGHVDADRDDAHAFWGRYAGVGVVLDPRIQGRGIVKTLYRVVLEALTAHDARPVLIKGGSSQPAVLGLGRVMDRPWASIGMRPGAPLASEHFLRFHPSVSSS